MDAMVNIYKDRQIGQKREGFRQLVLGSTSEVNSGSVVGCSFDWASEQAKGVLAIGTLADLEVEGLGFFEPSVFVR